MLLRFLASMSERMGVEVRGTSGLWYLVQGDQRTRFLGLSTAEDSEEGGGEDSARRMLESVVAKGSLAVAVRAFFERGDSRGGVGGRGRLLLSRDRRLGVVLLLLVVVVVLVAVEPVVVVVVGKKGDDSDEALTTMM